MKKLALVFLISILAIVGCNKGKNEKKKEPIKTQIKKERKVEDFLVFENLFLKPNIEGAEYSNITFLEEGALFTKDNDNPTYIKIPFSNLDLGKGFNVSFSFRTTDDDGRKPQSFIAFVDKFSSASRIPFYIYFPGNRVSGVYGKQLLWADGYAANNGNSKVYYDSFKLSKDTFYFVSVNFTGSKIELFVNSELYASFDRLDLHEFKSDYLLIGSLLQNNKIVNPFEGTLYGLKIYNQPLKESDIVSLFNALPVSFEY